MVFIQKIIYLRQIIKLDEYKSIRTHCVAIYVKGERKKFPKT